MKDCTKEVLDVLITRRGCWINGKELLAATTGWDFRSRIAELKALGFGIDSKRVTGKRYKKHRLPTNDHTLHCYIRYGIV